MPRIYQTMDKWRLWTCFMIIFMYFRESEQMTVNFDTLIRSINTDVNKTMISSTEVETFFLTLGGPNATRCSFMETLVTSYNGQPTRVSVMFDAMQSSDGQVLTTSEWRTALMGSTSMIDIPSMTSSLLKLEAVIDRTLSNPYENTDRLLWFKYSDLEVQRLADRFDSNSDGMSSRQEVTMAMWTMDSHGDTAVRRCHFIDTMTSYKQHAAAAANFYDFLFEKRDITWADVDSDFFLRGADDNQDGTVTRKELVDYFTLKNRQAAGLPVENNFKGNKSGNMASLPLNLNSLTLSFALLNIAIWTFFLNGF